MLLGRLVGLVKDGWIKVPGSDAIGTDRPRRLAMVALGRVGLHVSASALKDWLLFGSGRARSTPWPVDLKSSAGLYVVPDIHDSVSDCVW